MENRHLIAGAILLVATMVIIWAIAPDPDEEPKVTDSAMHNRMDQVMKNLRLADDARRAAQAQYEQNLRRIEAAEQGLPPERIAYLPD